MRGRGYQRVMIHIQGLRKSYGDLIAVDALDLEARPGEVLALLGPNGAGKSTTVQCLVGLLAPDQGQLQVCGHDLLKDRNAALRTLSYVPELPRLYEALTPREYLRLRGRLFDLDEATIDSRSERLLAGFGLSDRADEPTAGFSKGMTQKVSLASALLTEPRVLVLDEPLSGLDVETTMVLKELLRRFADRGGTVLYCSHLLDVVQNLADRIAVIDRGKLVALGTLAELRERAGDGEGRLETLFRQLTDAADPAARAREILGEGS